MKNNCYPVEFKEIHLAKFRECREETGWQSKNLRKWAQNVKVDPAISANLPDSVVDRDYLKNLCSSKDVSDEQCFIAIMAWGGMKTKHGELAWQIRASWIPIIAKLRSGMLTRKEAYQQFHDMRKIHPHCGMGPAYYTKIIFFAGPEHDGYIMDQWTSLSINLLTEGLPASPVKMKTSTYRGRRSDSVSDSNDAETYESFCQIIEGLAKAVLLTPEETEKRMFSQGGRNPAPWRSYVKQSLFHSK